MHEQLQDFIDEGFLTYNFDGTPGGQMKVASDCIRQHYLDYDWLSFLDVDEFLVLRNKCGASTTFLVDQLYLDSSSALLWHGPDVWYQPFRWSPVTVETLRSECRLCGCTIHCWAARSNNLRLLFRWLQIRLCVYVCVVTVGASRPVPWQIEGTCDMQERELTGSAGGLQV